MGVVWAEIVTTSIILVMTSKKCGYSRHGGRYVERAWGEHWSGVLAPLWVTLIEKAIVASPLYTFEHEYDSKGKCLGGCV